MRMTLLALGALAGLALAAPAQASPACTRAPGDYEGGPNVYLSWTAPHGGAGYVYRDAGLSCAPVRKTARWRPLRRAHKAPRVYARAGWVNVPLENVGGRCPKGDCDLLPNGARRHPA